MKQRNSFVFLVFSLFLLVGLVQLNGFFRDYFGDANDLREKQVALRAEVQREKLKTDLARHQLWDFQQDVAQILPVHGLKIKNHDDYRLAELTQTVRVPASVESTGLSSLKMTEGREAFQSKNYSRAAALFKEVIDKYPSSSQVVEAHFLLGESYYQLGNTDACLDMVYHMLNHFPESEFTGYLLLRNAEILKSRKRGEEATELYRMVSAQFSTHPALLEQVRRLASEND